MLKTLISESCVTLVLGSGDNSESLRGGAFNNNGRNARCAYRNRNVTDNRNNNNGFRVMLSTLLADPARNAVRVNICLFAFADEAKSLCVTAEKWRELFPAMLLV